MSKKKVTLDVILHDIEKNFITVKDSEQQFPIFKNVFDQIIIKMKEIDNYFNRYSSKIQYAGSFYDGVKVGKLDEFDMDIIIKLPISHKEIIIENDEPGFVKLKIERAFDLLDKQPNWETHHKVTRDWLDSDKYFLQSAFRAYMHSLVTKAVNALDKKVTVEGQVFNLEVTTSGPAFTVNCRSLQTKAVVDVDLVPAIQFLLPRWPEGYKNKEIEGDCNKNSWLVVPKPNKAIKDPKLQNQCWRLAFHDQERDTIAGCQKLKPTLRLLKKLRDSRGMKSIASYYIKTLFLWEINLQENNVKYWEGKQSILFKDMVQKLYKALETKNIPYYWNPEYNLIGKINPNVLENYKNEIKKVVGHLEVNSFTDIVKALLTSDEFEKFKHVETFKIYTASLNGSTLEPEAAKKPKNLAQDANANKDKSPANPQKIIDSDAVLNKILNSNMRIEKIMRDLVDQVSGLTDRVERLELKMRNECKEVRPAGDQFHSISDLLDPLPQCPLNPDLCGLNIH